MSASEDDEPAVETRVVRDDGPDKPLLSGMADSRSALDWLDAGVFTGVGLMLMGASFGAFFAAAVVTTHTELTWAVVSALDGWELTHFIAMTGAVGILAFAYNVGYQAGDDGGDADAE